MKNQAATSEGDYKKIGDFFGWIGIIPIFLLFAKDTLGATIGILTIFKLIVFIWFILLTIYAKDLIFFFKNISNFLRKFFLPTNNEEKAKDNLGRFKEISYVTTKVILILLSTVLSFLLCINIFKIPYAVYPLEFIILCISSFFALTFFSYQASLLFTSIFCINTINFYSENLNMLLINFNRAELIPLGLVISLIVINQIFPLKDWKKLILEILGVFALFALPYIIACIVDLMNDIEFSWITSDFWAQSHALNSSVIMAIFLGILTYYCISITQKKVIHVAMACVIFLLFFPAVKVHSNKLNANPLMEYRLLYEKALQEQDAGIGSESLHFEDAARAGHPKAMYKVAKQYLSAGELRYLNVSGTEKYVRYLYFAAILGEKDAVDDLRFLARTYESDSWFKAFLRVFYNHTPIEVKNFAEFYLGTYYAVDLGFQNLRDNSFAANNLRSQYRDLGKNLLVGLLDTRLEAKALLRLADVFTLEDDILNARQRILQAIETKDKDAFFYAGKVYLEGVVVNKDFSNAMYHLRNAKKLYHVDATYLWAREILDNKYSSKDDLDEAYSILIELFHAYHPQARIDVVLRYISDDPVLKKINVLSLYGEEKLMTSDEMYKEGVRVLEELAMLGKHVDFPDNTYAYIPTLFGAEIVMATYTLAFIYYHENDYESSLELLSRNTQKNDHKSRALLRKICAQHNINPNIYD